MPKVKVQAKKMSSPKAQFISLVGRGANKVPFRIIKQEKETMGQRDLDLAGLFRAKKQETVAPVVVGVVTMKDENFGEVKKQVEELGFATETAIELEDGSVVFKQSDDELEGTIFRLNDHVVLVVKGFEPYTMDPTVLGFGETAAAKTFFPGVRATMEALNESVYLTMQKSANPTEAGELVGKMFDEAKKYISSITKGLPEKAFKAEDITVVSEQIEEPAKQEEVKKEEVPAEEAKATETKVDESVQKSEEEPAVEGLTEEKVSTIVSTAMASVLDTIKKAMEEGFAGTNKATAELGEQVKTLQSRVEKSEEAVKEAKEAVGGVLVGGSDSGDVLPVAKSEQSEGLGCFDTAFNPKVRGK